MYLVNFEALTPAALESGNYVGKVLYTPLATSSNRCMKIAEFSWFLLYTHLSVAYLELAVLAT